MISVKCSFVAPGKRMIPSEITHYFTDYTATCHIDLLLSHGVSHQHLIQPLVVDAVLLLELPLLSFPTSWSPPSCTFSSSSYSSLCTVVTNVVLHARGHHALSTCSSPTVTFKSPTAATTKLGSAESAPPTSRASNIVPTGDHSHPSLPVACRGSGHARMPLLDPAMGSLLVIASYPVLVTHATHTTMP